MSSKCGLPFIPLANTDQVKGVLEINDRENFTTLHPIEEIMDERDRVLVLFCDGIEGSVIDAEAKLSSLTSDEQDWGGSRGCGAPNETLFEVGLNIVEQFDTLLL